MEFVQDMMVLLGCCFLLVTAEKIHMNERKGKDFKEFKTQDFLQLVSEVNNLKQLMVSSEMENEKLIGQVESLKKKVENVENKNHQLFQEVGHLKYKNHDLTEEIANVKTQNELLLKKIWNEIDYKLGVPQLEHTSEMFDSLEQRLSQIEEDLLSQLVNAAGKRNENFIGFTAYPTQTRDYSNLDIVLFDGVARNYGNAYNPNLSVFQCPVTGYYMFSMTFYTDNNLQMRGEIFVQGADTLVSSQSAIADFHSSSVVAVSYCTAGQLVWVRCTMDNNRLDGDVTRRSSFTGALMFTEV